MRPSFLKSLLTQTTFVAFEFSLALLVYKCGLRRTHCCINFLMMPFVSVKILALICQHNAKMCLLDIIAKLSMSQFSTDQTLSLLLLYAEIHRRCNLGRQRNEKVLKRSSYCKIKVHREAAKGWLGFRAGNSYKTQLKQTFVKSNLNIQCDGYTCV